MAWFGAGWYGIDTTSYDLGYAAAIAAVNAAAVGAGSPTDHSQDQLLLDGLEVLELDGVDIPYCLRLQEQEDEREPSEGVYLESNVEFHLPVGAAYYEALPAATEPSVGGILIDGIGRSYKIQAIRRPWLGDPTDADTGDYWGCHTRRIVIDGTYDLDDTVSLWPQVDALSAMGSRLTTYPAASADFTNVAAKIMLRPSRAETEFGQRDFVEQYDVYIAEDISQVRNGDLLQDQNLHWYSIVSYRNREEIGELSVMLCEDRIGGP